MNRKWLAVGLAMLASAYADTITLKNGRTVEGTYVGGDARRVRMTVGDAVQSFDTIDIVSIRFGDSDEAPTRRATNNQDRPTYSDRPTLRRAPNSSSNDDSRPTLRRAPNSNAGSLESTDTADERPTFRRAPRPADDATTEPTILRPERPIIPQAPQTVEIPADTPLTVRLIDAVDSEKDLVGQTYRASMDQPVSINGNTVIPRGADVVVKLVEDKQSGKLTGKTELRLDLSTVTVNGKQVDVLTQTITKESSSRTAGTAKKAGGGAAIGAIIGGIAGGGAGAAIGAAAGGAAGTASQVMTKGQRVKIPSETRLTFKLEQAIQI